MCVELRAAERPVCEVNGSGAPMIEVHPSVAEELNRYAAEAMKDDGTILRVGRRALLRTVDHAGRVQWGAQWYSGGEWVGTRYRNSPWPALWMLRKARP